VESGFYLEARKEEENHYLSFSLESGVRFTLGKVALGAGEWERRRDGTEGGEPLAEETGYRQERGRG
jgi:hypothetical protein